MLSPGTLLLLGCFLLLAFLFFLRLATFDYFNRELFGQGFDSIEEVVHILLSRITMSLAVSKMNAMKNQMLSNVLNMILPPS